MVDVDQNMPFELHAVADFLRISPLLELTSLAVLIQYTWVHILRLTFDGAMKSPEDIQRVFRQ